MPGNQRYVLSREEIGILLSFAKRPEAMTAGWIIRLRTGVDELELRDLMELAGVPRSTVDQIVRSQRSNTPHGEPLSVGFRRATTGTVVVMTTASVALLIATRGISLSVVAFSLVFALIGALLLKTITRLAPGIG